jgi:hypothetical protein
LYAKGATVTDDELMDAFEAGTLEELSHESHVRVAWCYLRRDPVLVALQRFRAALQRFAAGKGKADRYHETITVAFMLLILDRLGGARELPWEGFAARNPDLLKYRPSVLSQFYADDELASPRAREVFVLPLTTSSRSRGTSRRQL